MTINTQIKFLDVGFAERREFFREDIREQDAFRLEAQSSSGELLLGRVFDLSSSGLCAVFNDKATFGGHQLSLKLIYSKKISFEVQAKFIEKRANGKVVFEFIKVPCQFKGETFQSNFLGGSLIHPLSFEESIPFQLTGLGRDQYQVTVPSTHHYFSGMTLNLNLQGKEAIFEVQAVQAQAESLVLTLEGSHCHKVLSEWLISQQGMTPRKLRRLGLRAKAIAKHFHVKNITSTPQYREVLNLRYQAYRKAKKVDESKGPLDMKTSADEQSRILGMYHGKKLIASVALTMTDDNQFVLDTERALEKGYPQSFPQNNQMMEVCRLCIDPDYQGADIIFRFFEHIYRIFIASGRKYIVTSTDKMMWKMYQKLGFWKTGAFYLHPEFKSRHDLILIDTKVPTLGRSLNPLVWGFFYKKMTTYLMEKEVFTPNFWQRIRLSCLFKITSAFSR